MRERTGLSNNSIPLPRVEHGPLTEEAAAVHPPPYVCRTCGTPWWPNKDGSRGVCCGSVVSCAFKQVETDLVRELLEAMCRHEGVSLNSEVEPGKPARNYELAFRLGIGEVFGV